jgi:hypothetical protein
MPDSANTGGGPEDELAIEQLRLYEDELSKRKSKFDDDWQSISDLFLPQDSNITTDKPAGETDQWTDQVFDTTGIQAAMTYMAGDYNWTTPPQQTWAQYAWPKSLGTKPDDVAMAWLGNATDDIMETLARSNFYSMRSLSALSLGVFATDFLLFEEDEKEPGEFNFRHNRISTYTAAEDHTGIIDTTRREMKMTFRQIKQKFSKAGDTIPKEMAEAAKGAKGLSKHFKILHCIFPREDSDRLPKRKDGANMPIASVYISMDFKKRIRVGGYEEQPCLVPRFSKWGTEDVWGFGPAYIALPDARELNYMAAYMDAAAEKLIDPRLLIPSNLEGDVDLRAGGKTTYDVNKPEALPKEWASASEYTLGMEIMEQKRGAIREAFFVPAFKLLNSAPLLDKKMTAYEISQRLAEQLQGFTPALARRIPEFIAPLMRRAFAIRLRAGKLGKVPDSLFKKTGRNTKAIAMPEIVVTSRISDALKALKNRGIEETFAFLAPLNQERPDLNIYDNFIMDDTVVEYGRNTGMSPDLIRPAKGANSVAQIREARQKQVQAQQAAEMAKTLGQGGAGLGRSPKFLQDAAEQRLTGKAA